MKTSIYNDYYLVFTKTDHWTNRFTKRLFNHILVLAKDDYNWIRFDPCAHNFEWQILGIPSDTNPFPLLYKDCKVVFVRTGKLSKLMGTFGFLTCTSIIKYIVGLPISGLTPYQLYKKLAKIKSTCHNAYNLHHIQFIQ